MWTTSSFRADRATRGQVLPILAALATLILGSTAMAARTAPDAPRAAPAQRQAESVVQAADARIAGAPVELRSVVVRGVDDKHRALAGDRFAKDATEPLMIEIATEVPLPSRPGSSSPVIVLNGERLLDTWVVLPDRLVAFLPDRSRLKANNTVVVEWTGNEAATRTRKPLTFTNADPGRPTR